MISIVLPCYNEGDVLRELYQRLTAAALCWRDDYEVIVVDDCSRDDTIFILKEISLNDSHWRIIRFSRNFGHQPAIMAGLKFVRGDCAIIMDADLQDPPEEIFRFIEKWRENYKVVFGIRQNRKENIFKKLCYKLFYKILSRLANINIPTDTGDFCLIDRRIINILNEMPERNRFIRGLRAWTGFKQIGIAYNRQARSAGKSKYSFGKLKQLAIDGIFSFSIIPTRLTMNLGLVISIISFLIALYTLIWRLSSGDELPGYATIVISILFLGGVQLISIGILGEYIGRIYDEVKQRPLYIIDYVIGINEE